MQRAAVSSSDKKKNNGKCCVWQEMIRIVTRSCVTHLPSSDRRTIWNNAVVLRHEAVVLFSVNKQRRCRLISECWKCKSGWKSEKTLTISPPAFSSQELNLSYQDLGDPFQQENFLRILRRLFRVEKLQLVDNSLTDLSSVRLPRYEPHYPECTTTIK